MNPFRLPLACVFVLVAHAPADEPTPPREAPNPLRWKFVEGQPFYQETTTRTDQTIKVQGLNVHQGQQHTFVFKFEPLRRDGDRWVLRQTIEAVKMRINIAGNPVEFDSTVAPDGPPKTPLEKFFRSLVGSEFVVTLSKDLLVEKVAGREEYLKKLGDVAKPLLPLLEKVLSEESIREMADPTHGLVPPAAKAVGETWTRTSRLSLGPLGTYDRRQTCRYAKQDGDRAEIDIAVDLRYQPPAAAAAAEGLPFTIKDATLALVKDDRFNKSKAIIDTKAGRLESLKIGIKMAGALTVDIKGQITETVIEQEQTTEVRTFDKSPVPARRPE